MKEDVMVKDEVITELRESLEIWMWDEVEIQLSDYKKDRNDRHLMVGAVMAIAAFEAFLNNVIEFYRPNVEFESFDRERRFSDRFRKGIRLLDPEIDFNKIKSWGRFNELVNLRNKIVHKRNESEIMRMDGNGKILDKKNNNFRIDWNNAQKKILSVKFLVNNLHDCFQWDSLRLEGGNKFHQIEERFDSFFVFVKSKKDADL